jgi:hypothetical protein
MRSNGAILNMQLNLSDLHATIEMFVHAVDIKQMNLFTLFHIVNFAAIDCTCDVGDAV